MPRNANQSKQSNYSLSFDGSSYIDFGNSLNFVTSNYSLSFWIKTTSTTNLVICEKGANDEIAIQTLTSGNIRWAGTNGSDTSGVNVSDNNWHHLVFVANGSSSFIYIDGSLNTTGGNKIKASSNTDDFYIGSRAGLYGFNGQLDGVAIFNYALSSSQITTLWGGGTSVSNPMALLSPPIAYYPLGTSAWNGQYLAENNAIGDYVFDFDGADSGAIINCGNNSSLNITSALSISCWFNTSNTSDTRMIISKDSGINGTRAWMLNMNASNGTLVFRVFETGFTSGTNKEVTTTNAYNDGKWHFVTVTYEPSNAIKIYVDEDTPVLETTGIPSSIVSLLSQDVKIGTYGSYVGSGGRRWDGQLSNIQIFNTTLTASEVTTLYNYGSPIRTLANIPQSSNLKAWYKLDASEIYNSSTTDWSVDNNKYPSTYNSSINLVRASSQKIDIANGSELDFTGDFTMSIWVNLTTSNNNMGIFNKTSQANSNGVTLFKRGGANFEFYVSEYSNVLTFASQGDNIWQQITITLNRTTGERVAYINGEQAATLTHIKTFAFPNQGWDIGTFATNSLNYLDAKVSNFKLFNTVLSPTEVQTLYNNGTPLTDMSSFTSLKGWWKLNNLSSGLTDSSSNSNNATITSGTNEYAGFVNALAGDSTGMTQANLVQSDLQTVAPYSKYAMSFSGTGDYIDLNSDISLSGNKSVSFWVNFTSTVYGVVFGGATNNYYPFIDSTNISIRNGGTVSSFAHGGITAGVWYHICITGDGTNATAYLNGSLLGTQTDRGFTFKLINGEHTGLYGVDGKLSNCAIWNTVLTSSEVREVYNEGLPSNLNNFSGTAPVSWWQLGENSSYVSGWTFADEIGSNNGTGYGLAEIDLTNGVGTIANGTSTGMSEGNLVGNAPYSTGNAISSGMAVTAKGTDVP